ncbi:MAG: hypothetical protein L0Y70_07060 [Gemmataceae bacterium]|nr:hypothetical protein [Gemmataceae bacterium]
MPKTSTALLVAMLLCTLGLWGCTHQRNGANNAKIRELEARYSKLEEDYRVITSANDANRKKISLLETQRAELNQKVDELQTAVKERDELKKQLTTRTQERDGMHAQLVQFGKELQDLAGRIEAAAANAVRGAAVAALPTALPASHKP